jgi:hypothetical protein
LDARAPPGKADEKMAAPMATQKAGGASPAAVDTGMSPVRVREKIVVPGLPRSRVRLPQRQWILGCSL